MILLGKANPLQADPMISLCPAYLDLLSIVILTCSSFGKAPFALATSRTVFRKISTSKLREKLRR